MPDSLNLKDLEAIVNAWRAAGLDPAPMKVCERSIERVAQIDLEAKRIEGDSQGAFKLVARRVADGEISIAQGLAEHQAMTTARDPISNSNKMRRLPLLQRAVRAQLVNDAETSLRVQGDALIVDHINPALDDLAKAEEPTYKVLVGVGSAAEAVSAGAKTAEAWRIQQETAPKRRALYELQNLLTRRYEIARARR